MTNSTYLEEDVIVAAVISGCFFGIPLVLLSYYSLKKLCQK